MYSYTSFGLNIHSEIQFPELIEKCAPQNVVIKYGKINLPQFDKESTRKILKTDEGIILYWQDIGAFCIKNGNKIIVDPFDGVSEEKIRPFILGGTLGVLLRQRNLVVFHSSVIDINCRAVAFMARKGHGKSTMAAALYQHGNKMVTDDIMACDSSHGDLLILPGYPQFKLWPDTIDALGLNKEKLPRLYPSIEKRIFRFSNRFTSIPVPLRGVFVMTPGPKLKIERLGKKEALLQLMPHWYGVMFGGEMLKIFGIRNHIHECKKIIDQVPVFRLTSKPSIDTILITAGIVEEYIYKYLT